MDGRSSFKIPLYELFCITPNNANNASSYVVRASVESKTYFGLDKMYDGARLQAAQQFLQALVDQHTKALAHNQWNEATKYLEQIIPPFEFQQFSQKKNCCKACSCLLQFNFAFK